MPANVNLSEAPLSNFQSENIYSSSPEHNSNVIRNSMRPRDGISGDPTHSSLMSILHVPPTRIISLDTYTPALPSIPRPAENTLSFFPTFESSPKHCSDTSISLTTEPQTMLAPVAPSTWIRPTACSMPNPPRRRNTAIGFATNSFKSWTKISKLRISSSTPIIDPIIVSNVSSGKYPNIANQSQAWIRPTACEHPNPSRKRTIPIGFASTTFKSISPTMTTTPSLLSPVSPITGERVRSPNLARRATEPLIDSPDWNHLPTPSSTLELSPKLVTSTSPGHHDWTPVYIVASPKTSTTIGPCTRWMESPLYDLQVEPQGGLPQPIVGPDIGHRRTDSSDSDLTIRAACPRAISSSSNSKTVGVPYLLVDHLSQVSSYAAPFSPSDEVGSGILTEVSVKTIHPHLNRFTRPISPVLPSQPETIGLGLHDALRPASPSKTATESLVGVWTKHAESATKEAERLETPQRRKMRLIQLAMDCEGEECKGKAPRSITPDQKVKQPAKALKGPTPKPKRRPLLRRNSARSSLRHMFMPPPPPCSPNIPDRVFPTLSPTATINNNPFDNWAPAMRQRDRFDVDAVSAKLRAVVGMVNFEEIEGLGSPAEE